MIDAAEQRDPAKAGVLRNIAVAQGYEGKVWHDRVNVVPNDASIEQWRDAAGLNFKIIRTRVRYNVSATEQRVMNDRCVLVHSESRDALGVVSDKFQVHQPAEIAEFFRDLIDAAGLRMRTMGQLFGGKRFWCMASTEESDFILDPRDRVEAHLLISTACDGSMATEGRWTNVFAVCNNTIRLARQTDQARMRITHRSRFDPEQVRRELGIAAARERFADSMKTFRALAGMTMTPEDVVTQTGLLVEPKLSELAYEDAVKVLQGRTVRSIVQLALDGGQRGAGIGARRSDTQYNWLNAVTEFVDHHTRARSEDNRMNSAWFGPGDDLKSRALELATAGLVAA